MPDDVAPPLTRAKSADRLAHSRPAMAEEAIHAVIRERAEPGLPECDVVAAVCRRAVVGADGRGGDYPARVRRPMAVEP